MSTLFDDPSFTANEVYEIQATDPVEGAAAGASFGGLGLSNQPHQQLANRTALLKQRQDTNVANISALQAFQALFRGLMGQNGYANIPFVDQNRGLIALVVQWGYRANTATPGGGDQPLAVSWPIAFPSACLFAMATLARTPTTDNGQDASVQVVSFNATSGTFELDVINGPVYPGTIPGFYWFAIGF